jgi:hypothetical protein
VVAKLEDCFGKQNEGIGVRKRKKADVFGSTGILPIPTSGTPAAM